MQFRLRHQVQAFDRPLWTVQGVGQEVLEVLEHAVHSGLVEDVGAVVARHRPYGQVQVERQVRLGAEADVDQHRSPAAGFGLQLGDQVAERNFVRQGLFTRLAHARDDVGETGRATEVDPQRHQRADAEHDVGGSRVPGQQDVNAASRVSSSAAGSGRDSRAGTGSAEYGRSTGSGELLRRRGEAVTPETELRHLLHSVTVAHR